MDSQSLVHSLKIEAGETFELRNIEVENAGKLFDPVELIGSGVNTIMPSEGENKFKVSFELNDSRQLGSAQKIIDWFEMIASSASNVATYDKNPLSLKFKAKLSLRLNSKWTRDLIYKRVFPVEWNISPVTLEEPVKFSVSFSYDIQD